MQVTSFLTCIGQWRRDAAETTRDINSTQRLETEKQLEARRLLAELAAHQRAVARHVCNSDAFRVSETDSATNRESITILQLCSTQRRLTGLRPAHPRLSQHSHTLRVGRAGSHLKAPCVTWPARKTIGHALGVSEPALHTEKAVGRSPLRRTSPASMGTWATCGKSMEVGRSRGSGSADLSAGAGACQPQQTRTQRIRRSGCGTLTGARNCAKTAQARRHISELPGNIDRVHPAKSKGAAPGRRFLHRAGMHGVTLGAWVRQEQTPRICNRRTDRVSWSEAASTPASTRRPARTPQSGPDRSTRTIHPRVRPEDPVQPSQQLRLGDHAAEGHAEGLRPRELASHAFRTPGVSPTAETVFSTVWTPVPAVSWPWVLACGSLEPSRRGGENAQKTRKNGEEMGEIRSKTCEGVGITCRASSAARSSSCFSSRSRFSTA